MEHSVKPPLIPRTQAVAGPLSAAMTTAYYDLSSYAEIQKGANRTYRLSFGPEVAMFDRCQTGNIYGTVLPNAFEYAKIFATQAKESINQFLIIFFRANRQLLEAVYRTGTVNYDLHYSIVLKEDTDENRATIFSILDEPEIESLSSEYPVYFQFYSQRLKDRIQSDIKINL